MTGSYPVCNEIEALDHRKARLSDLVRAGIISGELREKLLHSLAEIELKMAMLRGQRMTASPSKSAKPSSFAG